MRIELSEELLDVAFSDGEHEGLITVVTGPPVSLSEGFGHGQLGHFFAVTKDSKLRFSGQYLPPTQQGCLSTLDSNAKILEDVFTGWQCRYCRRLCRCLLHSRQKYESVGSTNRRVMSAREHPRCTAERRQLPARAFAGGPGLRGQRQSHHDAPFPSRHGQDAS